MRNTRRTTSVLAVALVAVVAVTGCSKKSETTAATGTGGTSGAKQLKIAFVPKLQGIPYFEAMNAGGQKAAKDLNVQWIYKGSTTADPGAQTDIVKSLIQQKVDVLVVAPNDPDSMAPVLADAKAKGIKVMTSDTDAPNSVREVFVNQATADGIGKALTDALLEKTGGKGKYAIVSCGQTAANLNAWIAVQKKYTAEKYPNAQIVDTVYAGEDEAKAVSMAKDLMNAHPDLTGLVGECTSSAPGVAKAVREAGKIGKVFTVGLGTPQAMKPYLTDGSSSSSILWNVENLGYLTVWAGAQLANGKTIDAKPAVGGGIDGATYTAAQKMLLLGEPLRITKANVDQFNY
jgi:rhamnose transport system substrate-binding protein